VSGPLGAWLDLLDGLDEVERCVSAAWVGGRAVEIPEEETNEALRRALVVRAVEGSPQREVTLDEDAVARLADELDSAARREALLLALETLREQGADTPAASAAIDALLADDGFAWRCFAAGLLAAELGL
jgi:hypothetical protein